MKSVNYRKALSIVALLAAAAGAQTVWNGITSWTGNTPNQAAILAGCVIDSPEKLAELAFLVNKGNSMSGKTFTLSGDIALNKTDKPNCQDCDKPWVAIGDSLHPFRGTFKGGGFVVRGVYITESWSSFQGLFGNVKKPGSIEKLRVAESFISGSNCVGGLAGSDSGAAITDSYSTATVNGKGSNVGGLVGYLNRGRIETSYATGDVFGKDSVGGLVGAGILDTIMGGYATGTVTGTGNCVGGLVGKSSAAANSAGYAINAYATGDVIGNYYVGGLVGNSAGSIVNSYAGRATGFDPSSGPATNLVSGDAYVGGLVGAKTGGAMKNSYAIGLVSGKSYAGALAGSVDGNATTIYCYYDKNVKSPQNGFGIPNDDMTSEEFISLLNVAACALKNNKYKEGTNEWFYTIDQYPKLSIYPITESILSTCFGGGSGEESNPYRIATRQHLENLAVYVNCGADLSKKGCFKMINDIYLNDSAETVNNWSKWASGDKKLKAWTPIGQQPNDTANQANVRFNGNFDGDGRTVYGLYIDKGNGRDTAFDARYQGLFGRVEKEGAAPGGTVKNVGVSGAFVQGYCYVGGLAGWVNKGGKIIKCFVKNAKIEANGGRTGGGAIGGLVGLNAGGSLVINSYATAKVEGQINMAGGLVGWNSNKSEIYYSYAQGDVSVIGDDAGGLVGRNDGKSKVENCFANGEVLAFNDSLGKGGNVIGGLVGMNFDASVNKSYAIGRVDGKSSMGGLVGSCLSCAGSDVGVGAASYYKIDTANINGLGTPKSDIEMRLQSTYEAGGWNFDTVWAFTQDYAPGVQSYPYLGMKRAAPPVIERDPVGAWVDVGARANLSVAAKTTDGGVLSYQWYSVDRNQNSDGTKIEGATEAAYSVPTPKDTLLYYYAVVTNTSTAKVDESMAGSKTASASSKTAKVRVGDYPDAVLSPERAIPKSDSNKELSAISPPPLITAKLTAGPNPAGASRATPLRFFHKGEPVNNAELLIYDASGTLVKKIQNGVWDLTNAKGRPVSKGAYLAKGVVTGKDGKREKVSAVVGVR
jgi:hypothetical protein